MITRLSVGFLYDLFGFKTLYIALMSISLLNSLICYDAVHYPWLYFLSIQLNYIVLGGIFALYPAPASATFGDKIGVRVYALILLAAVAGTGFDTVLVSQLYDVIGLRGLF